MALVYGGDEKVRLHSSLSLVLLLPLSHYVVGFSLLSSPSKKDTICIRQGHDATRGYLLFRKSDNKVLGWLQSFVSEQRGGVIKRTGEVPYISS